jgi:hypothetical protein
MHKLPDSTLISQGQDKHRKYAQTLVGETEKLFLNQTYWSSAN